MNTTILRSLFLKYASSVFRTLLAALAAWLISRRNINADLVNATMEIGLALLPILSWSFIERYLIEKYHLDRLMVALRLPENSTLADLTRATAVTKELPDVDTSDR